jgi:hypothetical protein
MRRLGLPGWMGVLLVIVAGPTWLGSFVFAAAVVYTIIARARGAKK